MNTRQPAGHKTSSITASTLAATAAFPITIRDAVITRVRPEVRNGTVTRTIGEIQIFPDAGRIEIVLGVGVMDHERAAVGHNAVVLPHELRADADADFWDETTHRRTGERVWRCALFLAAPDPLLLLELEQLADATNEVHA
ncbi:hypothetical protein BIU98_16790 [Curtobacterium sp. MMLR14_010]|uniref:hypothetical protein n=1 Tax=Curtobacterium sp. MMLR14_010 TaxID=1898743 RepID=UPI0008DD2B54|nr:hypothetical protein [Curtobacterium sp. MMLR14_010]OII37109.1 hypothetical protein BIU98_16790 [Curtobacterium sp. MMLR14_010]